MDPMGKMRNLQMLQEPPGLPKLSLAAGGLNGDAGRRDSHICQDHHGEYHDHSS